MMDLLYDSFGECKGSDQLFVFFLMRSEKRIECVIKNKHGCSLKKMKGRQNKETI